MTGKDSAVKATPCIFSIVFPNIFYKSLLMLCTCIKSTFLKWTKNTLKHLGPKHFQTVQTMQWTNHARHKLFFYVTHIWNVFNVLGQVSLPSWAISVTRRFGFCTILPETESSGHSMTFSIYWINSLQTRVTTSYIHLWLCLWEYCLFF